jgi:chromosome segregation ATPase
LSRLFVRRGDGDGGGFRAEEIVAASAQLAVEQLQPQLEALKSAVEALSRRLDSFSNDVQAAKEGTITVAVQLIRALMTQVAQERASAQVNIEPLLARLDEVKAEVGAMRSALAELGTTLVPRVAEMVAGALAEQLRPQLESLSKAAQSLAGSASSIAGSLKSLDERLAKVEAMLARSGGQEGVVAAAVKELRAKVDSLERQLSELASSVSRVSRSIDTLIDELGGERGGGA